MTLGLLVPSCIPSIRKLKPEVTGHQTRLYLYLREIVYVDKNNNNKQAAARIPYICHFFKKVFFYFTPISQKFSQAMMLVFGGQACRRKSEFPGKPLNLDGRQLTCHIFTTGIESGRSGDKRKTYLYATQIPFLVT